MNGLDSIGAWYLSSLPSSSSSERSRFVRLDSQVRTEVVTFYSGNIHNWKIPVIMMTYWFTSDHFISVFIRSFLFVHKIKTRPKLRIQGLFSIAKSFPKYSMWVCLTYNWYFLSTQMKYKLFALFIQVRRDRVRFKTHTTRIIV